MGKGGEGNVHQQKDDKDIKATVTIDNTNIKRNITHYIAVFTWIGWLSFYLVFTFSVPLLYLYAKNVLIGISSLIFLSAILPIDRKKQPKWAYAIGTWCMKKASEYFKMKVIVEDVEKIKTMGPAVFALEPHDVLPLSIFAFNDCLEGLPGQKCLGCVTSACFSVPIMRHIYTWVNAYSVDKKSLIKMLSTGISPVLCPGGVQEVTLMENEKECVLYLNKRLGFVKLALQFGVPLVPCFSFGLRDSFSYWVPKGKFVHKVARAIGFLPMIFFGVFGIPMGPARPCNYTNVIGNPIIVPKIADPTEEELRKYHTIFVKELTLLFEKYKHDYGMGEVTLRIV